MVGALVTWLMVGDYGNGWRSSAPWRVVFERNWQSRRLLVIEIVLRKDAY